MELLPCPWCGDQMDVVIVSEGSTFRWRKVNGCCTDGPEVRHNTLADDQAAAEIESTAKAIEAWNTRPATTLAAREDGWRPLRDAPYGQEVVAQMDDSSQLVGAIRQSDEDWWWRGSYWSADRVQAWRPIGLPAAPPAQGTGEGS